jgi:hypothetical protein
VTRGQGLADRGRVDRVTRFDFQRFAQSQNFRFRRTETDGPGLGEGIERTLASDGLLERIDESIKARQKRSLWRIWAKALGEKASDCDRESDRVAIMRTVIAGVNLATCLFIVASIIRHW